MKKAWIVVMLVILVPALSFGQFKEQTKAPSFSQLLAKPTGVFLGFLNSEKLDMHHSFSMSYIGMGNGGMMVNSYMNTINYRISDPLFLRVNLGIMNSPYNSFNNPALNNTEFFGGAELFYRPTKNSLIKIGMDVGPGYYPRSSFYDEWYGW